LLKYTLKRLGLALITFSIIIFLVFVIIKSVPDFQLKPLDMSEEAWQVIVDREGWEKPILEQFVNWLRNIFVDGTFGFSHKQGRDASEILFSKIPTTLKLNIIPLILSIPIGISLGIVAVMKKNKMTDHVISTGVIVLISIPVFVLAMLLQYFLVYVWEILPSRYVATAEEWNADFWFGVKSYIMPIFVMTISSIAGWTRSVRAELTEQLTADYMLLARSKGLSKKQATFRHALKNAMVPFAPSIFIEFIGLISGSLIIEQIFRIDGVGRIYLEALNAKDYPLLMLNVCFYTAIGLIAGILADLSYSLLDPRIRVGSGKQND